MQSLVTILLLSITALGKVEKEKPKPVAKADKSLAAPSVGTEPPLLEIKGADEFAVPDFIRHDVDFWAKVYREWDTNQVVIYDSPTKIVYRVMNLPKHDFALSAQKYRKEVQAEVSRVTDALSHTFSRVMTRYSLRFSTSSNSMIYIKTAISLNACAIKAVYVASLSSGLNRRDAMPRT